MCVLYPMRPTPTTLRTMTANQQFPVLITDDGVSDLLSSDAVTNLLSPADIAALTPSQCKATNRQGEQCRKSSIPGGTVCIYHGGAAPQVRKLAAWRWSMIQSLALQVLMEQLSDEDATLMDPRAVLAIADRATNNRELLEGRATERREGMTRHEEVKLQLQGKLADLSERLESLGKAVPGEAQEEAPPNESP